MLLALDRQHRVHAQKEFVTVVSLSLIHAVRMRSNIFVSQTFRCIVVADMIALIHLSPVGICLLTYC